MLLQVNGIQPAAKLKTYFSEMRALFKIVSQE